MSPLRAVLAALVLSLIATQLACHAEREHDPAVEAAEELAPARQTVFGEQLLLFVEHPELVQGVSARFLVHLSVSQTGEPLREGRVLLEIGATRLSAEAPLRDGLFVPEGSLSQAGEFPARLVVESAALRETLELGSIRVHPDAAAAAAASAASASSAADELPGAVPFLMEQQWKLKLLLAAAQERQLGTGWTIPARSAALEGRSAIVSSSVGGRLVAGPAGALPRSGERVEAGQLLGFVEPPLSPAERAQLEALRLERELKTLELVRAAAEAEVRVLFAERDHARLTQLRPEGLGTQRELEQAEEALALARAERDGARQATQALERLELERQAPRLELRAPIAGRVVETRAVLGEAVEPGQPLLRILDTTRLALEGRVSEFDLPKLRGATRAAVEFAALPGRSFELAAGAAGPYIGPEVDPESRTLLVRYELDDPEGLLRAGLLGELRLVTGEQRVPVAIPRSAIVTDQGLPTVYVMLAGELFQRRDVELGIDDGTHVEVRAGLEPGERVATRGAYLVKLAALAPASFGHGHAH